jgi:hypothetical protein
MLICLKVTEFRKAGLSLFEQGLPETGNPVVIKAISNGS